MIMLKDRKIQKKGQLRLSNLLFLTIYNILWNILFGFVSMYVSMDLHLNM